MKDRKSLQLLSFTDFLETMCRIADAMSIPTDRQIAAARLGDDCDVIKYLMWCHEKNIKMARRPSANRLSGMASTRDFAEKLDKFLTMFYFSLYPEGGGKLTDDQTSELIRLLQLPIANNNHGHCLDYCDSSDNTSTSINLRYDELFDAATGTIKKIVGY